MSPYDGSPTIATRCLGSDLIDGHNAHTQYGMRVGAGVSRVWHDQIVAMGLVKAAPAGFTFHTTAILMLHPSACQPCTFARILKLLSCPAPDFGAKFCCKFIILKWLRIKRPGKILPDYPQKGIC